MVLLGIELRTVSMETDMITITLWHSDLIENPASPSNSGLTPSLSLWFDLKRPRKTPAESLLVSVPSSMFLRTPHGHEYLAIQKRLTVCCGMNIT